MMLVGLLVSLDMVLNRGACQAALFDGPIIGRLVSGQPSGPNGIVGVANTVRNRGILWERQAIHSMHYIVEWNCRDPKSCFHHVVVANRFVRSMKLELSSRPPRIFGSGSDLITELFTEQCPFALNQPVLYVLENATQGTTRVVDVRHTMRAWEGTTVNRGDGWGAIRTPSIYYGHGLT